MSHRNGVCGKTFAVVVLACLAATVGCVEPGGKFREIRNTQELRQVVTTADQPVVVEWYAIGCPACVAISDRMKQLSEEYGEQVTFVAVEHTKAPQLRQQYRISQVPTVQLFVDGKEQQRWISRRDLDAYRPAINQAISETSARRYMGWPDSE